MKKRIIKIVIVEDNFYYNKMLLKYVHTICSPQVYPGCSFDIRSYLNAEDCIEDLDDDTDIMILDYYLNNNEEVEQLNGGDVLSEVKRFCNHCKVIIVSAMSNSHITADLMKRGVFEYIDKNISAQPRIGAVLQSAIENDLRQHRADPRLN